MPFPGTSPVLTATSPAAYAVHLSWTAPIPDAGVVVFDYAIAYTRVDPAPPWPPAGGPFTPDGGWFVYAPHRDGGTPRPPTTTKDIGIFGHDNVLHHFIVEASFAPEGDPFSPGWYLPSNVADGTPLPPPPPPPPPPPAPPFPVASPGELSRLPFELAQRALRRVLGPDGRSAQLTWHGQEWDPETGSFAVVRADGPLADLVGKVVQVSAVDSPRSVVAFVHRASDVYNADISLSRRAFAALYGLAIADSVLAKVTALVEDDG